MTTSLANDFKSLSYNFWNTHYRTLDKRLKLYEFIICLCMIQFFVDNLIFPAQNNAHHQGSHPTALGKCAEIVAAFGLHI